MFEPPCAGKTGLANRHCNQHSSMDSTQDSTPDSTNWGLVVISYVSLLVLGFMDNLRGPTYGPMIAELGLSHTQGAAVFATTSVFATVSAIIASESARMSALNWLLLGLGIAACGYWLEGHAISFGPLLAFAALFGFGFGWISVGQNTLLSESCSERWRARLFSGLHSIYGLAGLLAPIFVDILNPTQWRQAWTMASGLPLALLAVAWHWSRRQRKLQGPRQEKLKLTKQIKWQAIWCGLFISMYLFCEITISTRLVYFLTAVHGWSFGAANTGLALFFLGLFVSRLLGLAFSLPARISVISVLLASLGLSLGLLIVGLLWWPIALCGLGVTLGPFVPYSMEYLSFRFGALAGNAIAYTFALFSVVVVFLHLMLGVITDTFGIQNAMLILAPFGLIFSFVAIALTGQRPITTASLKA